MSNVYIPTAFGPSAASPPPLHGLHGKGMYIWMLRDTEGGDMQRAAQVAVDAGITHVMIKIADGRTPYNLRPVSGGWVDDILKPAVKAFRDRGIKVWVWQYVYLYSPEAEARLFVQRAEELEPDGAIYDVEGEAKNKPVQAQQYLAITKPAFRAMKIPTALSSYRWPKLHMELPWKIWMQGSDFDMPQVYWMGASNSGYQLERSLREFTDLSAQYGLTGRGFIPSGAAFSQDGWTAQPGEIRAFLQKAVDLKLPAANFWVWSHARRMVEGQWAALAGFEWPGTPPPPPPDTVALDVFVKEHVYPFMKAQGYSGPAPA